MDHRTPSTDAVDLDGLEGVFRSEPEVSRRAARVLAAVTAAAVVGLVTWTAVVVAAGTPHQLWPLASTVVMISLTWLPVCLSTLRSPCTRLTPHALVVRTGALTETTTAWQDVLEVSLPGRWDEHSSALLRDGSQLPLPGLDQERTERLARVVARLHHRPVAADEDLDPAPLPQHPDDLGLEGPFRTARGRRLP